MCRHISVENSGPACASFAQVLTTFFYSYNENMSVIPSPSCCSYTILRTFETKVFALSLQNGNEAAKEKNKSAVFLNWEEKTELR